jgi:hypothetical protein
MLSRTATHVHQLFLVTTEQSTLEARELLGAIESKGGECTNWSVVTRLVETQLPNRLQWRNASDRIVAENRHKDTATSYNAHIESGRDGWQKKW